MIDGVYCTKLNIISTSGGDVLHAMKNIDNGFVDFGEAYFSEIEFNKVNKLNEIQSFGRVFTFRYHNTQTSRMFFHIFIANSYFINTSSIPSSGRINS